MEDCIFCKIINGDIPSSKVYEDGDILAFNDINPVAPVHVLVIPKKHIKSLADMDDGDELIISKIYKVINQIVDEKGINEKGYRVVVNCGVEGGQEVGHLHFHLIGGKQLGTNII